MVIEILPSHLVCDFKNFIDIDWSAEVVNSNVKTLADFVVRLAFWVRSVGVTAEVDDAVVVAINPKSVCKVSTEDGNFLAFKSLDLKVEIVAAESKAPVCSVLADWVGLDALFVELTSVAEPANHNVSVELLNSSVVVTPEVDDIAIKTVDDLLETLIGICTSSKDEVTKVDDRIGWTDGFIPFPNEIFIHLVNRVVAAGSNNKVTVVAEVSIGREEDSVVFSFGKFNCFIHIS